MLYSPVDKLSLARLHSWVLFLLYREVFCRKEICICLLKHWLTDYINIDLKFRITGFELWPKYMFNGTICIPGFFFWPCPEACVILVPWPGLNPHPCQWKQGVLTTGPPGNSPMPFLIVDLYHPLLDREWVIWLWPWFTGHITWLAYAESIRVSLTGYGNCCQSLVDV